MKISLLQWNIWFKENINKIITQLKRINADIVTIQELCITENDKSNFGKLKDILSNDLLIGRKYGKLVK